MGRHLRQMPIYASLRTAAALLDMPPAEFARLVDRGSLPGPVRIAGHERWDTEHLRKIATGEAIDPDFEP